MKESELLERGLHTDEETGIIIDDYGNEYRNEEGSIEYLEIDEEEELIVNKYPFIPTSVIKVKRHKKEQDLRKERNITKDDKFFTNSSRSTFGNFDFDIGRFILKYYAKDSKTILDPFSGWGERGFIAKELNYDYRGFDISPKANEYAKEKYDVENNTCNSMNLPLEDNSIDFCYTCPPYFNLEKYESIGGQLTDFGNYDMFLQYYEKVIKDIKRVLKKDSLCVFVVGDFRIKNTFSDFSTDTINLFIKNGFKLFDKVIIDKSINYRISMFLQQAEKLGYVVKLHEYILVFKK